MCQLSTIIFTCKPKTTVGVLEWYYDEPQEWRFNGYFCHDTMLITKTLLRRQPKFSCLELNFSKLVLIVQVEKWSVFENVLVGRTRVQSLTWCGCEPDLDCRWIHKNLRWMSVKLGGPMVELAKRSASQILSSIWTPKGIGVTVKLDTVSRRSVHRRVVRHGLLTPLKGLWTKSF